MPDFFEGQPADISWYPPDTDEKGKKLGDFFNTTAAPPKTVERVAKVMQDLREKNPEIKNWGVLGYCWGGKVCPRPVPPRVASADYNGRSSTLSLSKTLGSRRQLPAILPWSIRMMLLK